jgi:predicted RNA-binding Zn-ribbon protein involved in translation (DUF1610 family)
MSKDNCVSCGWEIDPRFYEERGNYCPRCNNMASRLVRGVAIEDKYKRREFYDFIFKDCKRFDLVGSNISDLRIDLK